ncbi:hypothetical protein [Azotobacter beijerinckii]|uniref:hypothetical protein n=1 Tax=Azotobacter beijerinckii TaxID=170623 RepID=UPI001160B53B|nr:hypothetical protein [Azotobacter beijerinckii]
MPITLTFDIENASIADTNDRTRIIACFQRFGWEHIGGSAWRYPALGTENVSEDWFNHVIPALAYFRSIVCHGNLDVYNFTIDAHSEAGHRGRANPPLGEPIQQASDITLYQANPTYDRVLSEQRLRGFVQACADQLA